MTKVHAFRGTKKKKCFKDTRRRLRNSCTCLHLIFCRPYRLVKTQMLRTKGSTGCFPILLSRTQHQRWACNTVTRGAELLMYSAFIFHEQTFSCSSHSSRLQLRSMIIGRQTDLLKRKQREGVFTPSCLVREDRGCEDCCMHIARPLPVAENCHVACDDYT